MEKKKTIKKVPTRKKVSSKKTVKAGGARKTLPQKEEAAVDMEVDVATASKKPVVPEGQVSPDTIGRAAAAIVSGESRLGALGRERYFEAVGRRKTAVARVRLFTKAGDFTVNNKLHNVYFSTPELLKISEDALQKMKLFGRFKVTVEIKGGGMHAQAEALRQGLSRCLVKFNPDFRKRLRKADFLKRDSRMKERKKPGLKRARKAPQWHKR